MSESLKPCPICGSEAMYSEGFPGLKEKQNARCSNVSCDMNWATRVFQWQALPRQSDLDAQQATIDRLRRERDAAISDRAEMADLIDQCMSDDYGPAPQDDDRCRHNIPPRQCLMCGMRPGEAGYTGPAKTPPQDDGGDALQRARTCIGDNDAGVDGPQMWIYHALDAILGHLESTERRLSALESDVGSQSDEPCDCASGSSHRRK